MAAWGTHVGALALAPISIVQTVIAGGLVLLTVVADRLFGIEVTRREWIGVALTATGLAFLAATLHGTAVTGAHSRYDATTLAVYVAAGDEERCLKLARDTGYDAWLAGSVRKEGRRKAVEIVPEGITFEGDTLRVR